MKLGNYYEICYRRQEKIELKYYLRIKKEPKVLITLLVVEIAILVLVLGESHKPAWAALGE